MLVPPAVPTVVQRKLEFNHICLPNHLKIFKNTTEDEIKKKKKEMGSTEPETMRINLFSVV